MTRNPHPRVVFAKGTHVVKNAARAVVYAPGSPRAAWIERELLHDAITIETAHDLTAVIAALADAPSPRPQILVLDFDVLGPGEILELHAIRERGWCGTIFAVGKVPIGLRKSLQVDQVLTTLVDHALRVAVTNVGFDAKTRRVPVFRVSARAGR